MLKTIFSLPADLYRNRRLVMKLAKNDFKTRYAGSYFGTIWAFVQPVVTILVYWFVFSVGFRSNTDELGIPFVLYLVAGIVPWFFFSDALSGGTNALIEYNYLVKKVVFNISVLPVVKIISALFVHGFFVILAIILYMCNGRFPDMYYLQIFYYSACAFFLVTGLCYATSAIVVLFRDLGQIIGIILQIGVWITPIMWVAESMIGCTEPTVQNTSVESNVLYCVRIQRCLYYKKMVLGKTELDHLLLGSIHHLFPVRKLDF